jgi:hypothetical protein
MVPAWIEKFSFHQWVLVTVIDPENPARARSPYELQAIGLEIAADGKIKGTLAIPGFGIEVIAPFNPQWPHR